MKGIVESALHVALRGLSLRQRVIADNVANADTPGFKASEVHFEDRLRLALQRISDPRQIVDSVHPRIETPESLVARFDQSSVDLDHQLLAMTETSVRYNAIARAMSDRLALYRMILNDGRS